MLSAGAPAALPTASAVLGDLLDAAHNLTAGGRPAPRDCARAPVARSTTCESAFYLSLDVADRPGVLAAVAGVLGAHGCRSARWSRRALGGRRPGWCSSPTPPRGDVQAPRDCAALDVVDRIGGLLRVVGRRRRAPDGWPSAWRGVIEEYREFLPVSARHARGDPAGGRHPAAAGAPAVRAGRGPGGSSSKAPTRPARSRTAA